MPHYISPPPMNPISRILAGIVGILALAGAFFFGVIVLGVVVAVGLIAWLVFTLRLWWAQRSMPGGSSPGAAGDFHHEAGENRAPGQGEVIDAEYTVVSRDETKQD